MNTDEHLAAKEPYRYLHQELVKTKTELKKKVNIGTIFIRLTE